MIYSLLNSRFLNPLWAYMIYHYGGIKIQLEKLC